jgi:hypothetical protein
MSENEVYDRVQDCVKRRAFYIAEKLSTMFSSKNGLDAVTIIIAGGCLGSHINDVDIFRCTSADPELPAPFDRDSNKPFPLITSSRNARTYETKHWPIQLCNYAKTSPQELVESFDFAHIQAGAVVRVGGPSGECEVKSVHITQAFIVARATETTWFTGSDYPISSVIRAGKYYKSGVMSRGVYLRAVLDAMGAAVDRGVQNYDDYKDQLDAVDLGLVGEEMGQVERAGLLKLFEGLHRSMKSASSNGLKG